MTPLLAFAICIALVMVVGLEVGRRAWVCRICGRRGGPMVGGTVDEPICPRCVCPAHPYIGRAIIRGEWVNDCIPGCWSRIPVVDLRRQ